jgi:asparagine synthase (glutamine-hydrolysing)
MCGFAGVVTWDDRYRVSPETLAKMSAAVAHRGPDGEGAHINHQDEVTSDRPQVAMAFRRLAILDPDPRSNQPFTDGRFWLVFNGEIYNFRELRKELAGLRPEYQWRTSGDTEVLLCAFAVWGEKCVEHLNGMFAFVIWDERERSLFLARDRMGQKPLYVAEKEGVIAFASEVAALRNLTWINWRLYSDGLGSYLRYGCTDRFFYGCHQLAPSFTQTQPAGSMGHERCYFDPSGRHGQARSSEGDTRSLVSSAVSRQLVSDVPLGVFLSGGVDSSVIAAAARRQGPVKTFAIGFNDPRYDESRYATTVAEHLKTEHLVFQITPSAAEDLPKIAGIFGEPFGDSSSLAVHYLSRETRKHVKVALSGDGGDELFGGYDRYRAMRLGGWLKPLSVLAPLARTTAGGHPKAVLTRAARFISSLSLGPDKRYDSYVRLFDESLLRQLVLPDQFKNELGGPAVEVMYRTIRKGMDNVRAALATDRMSYLPDDLLTKVDRCSMMHGLEVRSPFMDHELVQFAAGLTTDQLLGGGPKRMLREAFAEDLPAWVFKRKKMGFAVPIGEWFRGELRGMLRDTLFSSAAFGRMHFDMKVVERLVEEHEQERVDHSQRLYALLMLELWWNTVKK